MDGLRRAVEQGHVYDRKTGTAVPAGWLWRPICVCSVCRGLGIGRSPTMPREGLVLGRARGPMSAGRHRLIFAPKQ